MGEIRQLLKGVSEDDVQSSGSDGEQATGNRDRITVKNEPLRIVILEVENGMLGNCCARGFKDMGHISKRIAFKTDDETHLLLAFDVFGMVREVMDFAPDFVFSINFRGLDTDGVLLRAFTLLRIPVIVWYVDNPFLLMKSFDSLSGIISLIFDGDHARKLIDTGVERVYHLPLGVDVTVFRKIQLDPEDEKKYRCNLRFVGKLDLKKVEILRKDLKNRWPEIPSPVIEVINDAVKRNADVPTRAVSSVIQEACDEFQIKIDYPSEEIRKLVEIIVEFEAGGRYRVNVIKELSGFDIKVCGEEEWLTVVAPSHLAGPVPYFGDLVKIYNASRINLNISRVQLRTTVNQRVFDVPACRAFLITDHKEELGKYFEIGKEIVCYRDIFELKKLVEYYLRHPKEREKIAEAGYRRVLRDHTYAHRMQRVVDIYHENLPTLWQEGEKKDGNWGRAYDILGRVYLQMNEHEKAVSCLKRSLALVSNLHEEFNDLGASHLIHYHLGRCCEDTGDYEASAQHYRESIEIKPDFIDALSRLGTFYLKHRDYLKAKATFEKAVEIDPEDPSFFSNLAFVYSKLGNTEKAEGNYRRCLDIDPDFLEALTNLGHLYLRDERLDKAEGMFERALTVHGFQATSNEQPATSNQQRAANSRRETVNDKQGTVSSELIDVHLALGCIYARRFEIERCVKECDCALQILKLPRNFVLDDLKDLARLYCEIGLKLQEEKRFSEASLALETAATIHHAEKLTVQVPLGTKYL